MVNTVRTEDDVRGDAEPEVLLRRLATILAVVVGAAPVAAALQARGVRSGAGREESDGGAEGVWCKEPTGQEDSCGGDAAARGVQRAGGGRRGGEYIRVREGGGVVGRARGGIGRWLAGARGRQPTAREEGSGSWGLIG